MHYRIAVWGLDLSNLILRPLLEHFFHIYGGLLQHLIPDVGVDVGGGLIVGMADDLHCDGPCGRSGRESLRQGKRGAHVGWNKATPHQNAARCGTMKGCR